MHWFLVAAGMSVARLNMSHGSHESHKAVIDLVQAYNETGRGCVATMLDTKVTRKRDEQVFVSPAVCCCTHCAE
jgi:pyruvate kinase